MYETALKSFWTTEEVELYDDISDWHALTADEKHFIKTVLAFFAVSDGIVNENLIDRFHGEVDILEAKLFYKTQMAIENIHSEMYSLLLDTYMSLEPEDERNYVFNAIENISCIKHKSEWIIKWINDNTSSFTQRLVAFAIVEGVFFSGSFASIFWFRKRGKLPGLCFSNELISRDEGMHTDFACMLYKEKGIRLDTTIINNMIDEAVSIETAFFEYALPVRLIGLNSDLMTQYIKYVADRLLVSLDHEKLYNIDNPFDFMEMISLEGKTNFFEKKVGEYQKFVGPTTEDIFCLDEEF